MSSAEERRLTGVETLPRYGGHSVGTWANALLVVALAVIESSLLFSYYMIQHESPSWPPEGYAAPPLTLTAIATLTLLASGFPLGLAYLEVRRNLVDRLFLSLSATFTLGFTFFIIQSISYARLDIQPVTTVYSALVVALAGFHLAMTLIGLVVAGLVIYRAMLMQFHSGRYLAIETLLFIWGFVIVSGLLTAGTLYVNPHL